MSVNAEQMSADALALRLFSSNERLAVADARRLLDELKDAYAHELAEKAAAEMSGCCEECDAAIAVMRSMIDPKVSSNG